MARIPPETLRTLARDCFQAAGYPAEEAAQIARLIVLSNLRGHDSHGVRQIPRYLQYIREGKIVAGAPVQIVQETATTATLDGHRTAGHVAATKAAEVAIAKARASQVSAVTIRNLYHVGRLGAYTEMAAAAGLIGLGFVSGQGHERIVTPFGGIQARFSTSPFSACFPNPDGDPILLDFATSVVAANKIRLALDRGQSVPEGWMIDAEGKPLTDPQAYQDHKATLLPLGGEKGYKGYGLAVMNEIMTGIMSGTGTVATAEQTGVLNNVTFLICIDPQAFVTREFYDREIRALVEYLHATRVRPGDPAVMLPGEYEERAQKEREANGIEIEDQVWAGILKAAEQVGVKAPVPVP